MDKHYLYEDVKNLKYWVHAILPLVYDDSLSYYEVLAKVSAKMNEVIEQLNKNSEQIDKVTEFTVTSIENLTQAFNNFQAAMLERQDNFEKKLLKDVADWEEQLMADIDEWEKQLKSEIDEWEKTLKNEINTWETNFTNTYNTWKNQLESDIAEWERQLKADNDKWKADTTDELNTWKSDTENALNEWKNETMQSLETWKSNTESDIASWKQEAESDIASWKEQAEQGLDTWKQQAQADITKWETDFQSKYNSWKSEFESTYNSWQSAFEEKYNTWQSTFEASYTEWKNGVDSDLAAWKTQADKDIQVWESAAQGKLDEWKTATESDLNEWKTNTENDLNTWKQNFQGEQANWESDLQQNLQDKIDGLSDAYVPKSDVVSDLGDSTEKVISQLMTKYGMYYHREIIQTGKLSDFTDMGIYRIRSLLIDGVSDMPKGNNEGVLINFKTFNEQNYVAGDSGYYTYQIVYNPEQETPSLNIRSVSSTGEVLETTGWQTILFNNLLAKDYVMKSDIVSDLGDSTEKVISQLMTKYGMFYHSQPITNGKLSDYTELGIYRISVSSGDNITDLPENNNGILINFAEFSQKNYNATNNIRYTYQLVYNPSSNTPHLNIRSINPETGDVWEKSGWQKILFNADIIQTTGQSTAQVMSQKAVTDELGKKASAVAFTDNTAIPTISGVNTYENKQDEVLFNDIPSSSYSGVLYFHNSPNDHYGAELIIPYTHGSEYGVWYDVIKNGVRSKAIRLAEQPDLNALSKRVDDLSGGGSGVTIVQTTGQSTSDVMSQKAVTDELNKKANSSDYVAKTDVVQATGQSTSDVMSQKAVTDELNNKATSASVSTLESMIGTTQQQVEGLNNGIDSFVLKSTNVTNPPNYSKGLIVTFNGFTSARPGNLGDKNDTPPIFNSSEFGNTLLSIPTSTNIIPSTGFLGQQILLTNDGNLYSRPCDFDNETSTPTASQDWISYNPFIVKNINVLENNKLANLVNYGVGSFMFGNNVWENLTDIPTELKTKGYVLVYQFAANRLDTNYYSSFVQFIEGSDCWYKRSVLRTSMDEEPTAIPWYKSATWTMVK